MSSRKRNYWEIETRYCFALAVDNVLRVWSVFYIFWKRRMNDWVVSAPAVTGDMILRSTPRSTRHPVCCECCELEATGPRPRAQSHLFPGDHLLSSIIIRVSRPLIWCPSQLPGLWDLSICRQLGINIGWRMRQSSRRTCQTSNIHDSCCTILRPLKYWIQFWYSWGIY